MNEKEKSRAPGIANGLPERAEHELSPEVGLWRGAEGEDGGEALRHPSSISRPRWFPKSKPRRLGRHRQAGLTVAEGVLLVPSRGGAAQRHVHRCGGGEEWEED